MRRIGIGFNIKTLITIKGNYAMYNIMQSVAYVPIKIESSNYYGFNAVITLLLAHDNEKSMLSYPVLRISISKQYLCKLKHAMVM